MARLTKQQLLNVVEAAVLECGRGFLHLSSPGDHPARYHVYLGGHGHRTLIYIWNLTHGGGAARPAHEYRIQITGVPQFRPEVGGKTLVLGWWDDVGIFAGFDYSRHTGVLGHSPSMQIGEPALRSALKNGFALHRRGREEIAIAFRSDFLCTYIDNLESLHGCGEAPIEIDVLNRISEDPSSVNDDAIADAVVEPRRYAVSSTRRAVRDNNFRARILQAYGHRCAICGVQLKLVEGAHILPAVHPDSTDETSNGVALCVLHHRAYDRGFITFDSGYRTHLNANELANLERGGLDGGLDDFREHLRPIIIVPPDERDRPNDRYVSVANELRGWPL